MTADSYDERADSSLMNQRYFWNRKHDFLGRDIEDGPGGKNG